MRELVISIGAWIIGIFIMTIEIILGLSVLLVVLAPSDQEVQCTSIEGAKWSGNSCYKNGIKINFND